MEEVKDRQYYEKRWKEFWNSIKDTELGLLYEDYRIGEAIHKKRIRLVRGFLMNFYDLPEFAQINFKIIKKFVNNHYKKDIKVLIQGSYLHGNWDEFSDYDVLIKKDPIGNDLSVFMNDNLYKELGFTVNAILSTGRAPYFPEIEIP